jgi:hypothetical protein
MVQLMDDVSTIAPPELETQVAYVTPLLNLIMEAAKREKTFGILIENVSPFCAVVGSMLQVRSTV